MKAITLTQQLKNPSQKLTVCEAIDWLSPDEVKELLEEQPLRSIITKHICSSSCGQKVKEALAKPFKRSDVPQESKSRKIGSAKYVLYQIAEQI